MVDHVWSAISSVRRSRGQVRCGSQKEQATSVWVCADLLLIGDYTSSIPLANSIGANSNSAALSVHMIPSMIEQGYRAIAVAFDLWGFSNMVKEKLDQATEYAIKHGEKKEE